jgi:hypothetical protein
MRNVALLIALCAYAFCIESSAITHKGENFLVIKDLRVLIVVYRGETNAPPEKRINDHELEKIKNAIECGRLFYFRNSRGELALTLSYCLIDTVAPDNAVPSYDNIVSDLRNRGYVDNQYDGIFTTGIGLGGNWGGFSVFDKTGAAFGGCGMGGQLRQFPSADTNTAYDAAWIFVHEFQHAVDLAIAGGAGFDEFLHGHPYTDNNEHERSIPEWIESPGAQHWDWEACTLRNFKQYIRIPGATSSQIYAPDADMDGLADYHPSLPMDEKRFGSRSDMPDTDRDGLNDLEEFIADKYRGADPLKPDTDCDGIRDNEDLWPTVAITPEVGYANPVPEMDGKIDAVYTPLITRWYATDITNLASDAVQLRACWDEENLYLIANAPTPFTLELQLDTSPENSFWIGGDTYVLNVKHDMQPSLIWPGKTEWSGARAVWNEDENGNTVAEIILPACIGKRGVTSGQEFPEDMATALRLQAGKPIACNVAFDMPERKKRVLLTPTWTMVSTLLHKTETDPDLPTLRYSIPMQNTKKPVVVVKGIKDTSVVMVKSEKGVTRGTRTGSGPVTLTGVQAGNSTATGKNVLVAETEQGKKSAPFELTIDTSAISPEISIDSVSNSTVSIRITGESNAVATLERKTGADKWQELYSVVLDNTGSGIVSFDTGFRGFRGVYYNTKEWTEPVFYRLDPVIDFNYKDGSPVKGFVDPDSFSMHWTGTIDIDEPLTAEFFLATDDGSRLYIDDKKIIDNWGTHGIEEKSAKYTFQPGEYEIRIDYYENLGWAGAHLEWQPEGNGRTNALPVHVSGQPILRARQKDVLGNESAASTELTVQ